MWKKAEDIDRDLHKWCDGIGGEYTETRRGTVTHSCEVASGEVVLQVNENDEAYLDISGRDGEYGNYDVSDLDLVRFDHGRVKVSKKGLGQDTFRF